MRIGVLTSGGDAPGMNAAIRAVVRAALDSNHEIFGIEEGYKGLVEGKIIPFNRSMVSTILNSGGTILRTARLPEFTKYEVRKVAYENLKKYNIQALITIGGDGTFRGAKALSELGVKCIGIPGTIDNDIASSDYTIGFSTALNTACEAIDKLRDTSSSHQRCSVIEVMGRNCPDLALYSGICCGAEYIITKDTKTSKEELLESLKANRLQGRRHAIVVVSENLYDVHKLAKEIEQFSGYECRATVLGYVQRGGCPTPEDRLLACRLGAYAIDLLNQDVANVCVGIKNNKLIHTEFALALDKVRKESKELMGLVNKLA